MQLGELTDSDLVARIACACADERRLVAEVVAYLIEVKRRELHLIDGYSSLFDFCTRRLGMSNGAAFRRMNAAKLAKQYPFLLPRLASGQLHLSGLLLLRDHLNDANAEELADAASGKSESEIEALLVARWPKPPVPERIAPVSPQTVLPTTESALPPAGPPRRSHAKPLSPTTFHLQLTMGAETHAKLLRARDMMRHRQPDGDLAVVVDRALDALLAQLERQVLAKAARPRATSTSTKAISRGARREVFARDGQQCTYRSVDGNRCPARAFLELDHATTRSRGGDHQSTNLRVYCHAHNQLHARQDFGDAHVDAKIGARRARAHRRGRSSAGGSAMLIANEPVAVDEATMTPSPKAEDSALSTGERAVAGTTPTARDREGHADRDPRACEDTGESGRIGTPERETMIVAGLAGLGFAKADCVVTARSILARGAADRAMADVFREAIGVLAALPRRERACNRRTFSQSRLPPPEVKSSSPTSPARTRCRTHRARRGREATYRSLRVKCTTECAEPLSVTPRARLAGARVARARGGRR